MGRRGFTLIELMVTLVLAFVIIGAVYAMYAQSIASYRTQGQFLATQDRLRFGLEHLKRDLRRAGFQATPNSASDPTMYSECAPRALRAISVSTLQHSGEVHRPSDNVHLSPSSATLFGDFFFGRTCLTQSIAGTQVVLQQCPGATTGTELEFNRIFDPAPGVEARYLRLVSREGRQIYRTIADADFATRTITLDDSVPVVGTCGLGGISEGIEVNVVGFVRYRIIADERPAGADDAPEEGKTDLIREELQLDGVTPVEGSRLVIADYAVDLQFFDFGFQPATAAGTYPEMYSLVTQVADSVGGGLLGTSESAISQRLRFLTVKLTVRTEQEDPEFPFVPRSDSAFEPLLAYELSGMAGACRTSTLAARVELPALAVRNLR